MQFSALPASLAQARSLFLFVFSPSVFVLRVAHHTRALPFADSKLTPQPSAFRACSSSLLRRTRKALFGLILTTVRSSINVSILTSQSPGLELSRLRIESHSVGKSSCCG